MTGKSGSVKENFWGVISLLVGMQAFYGRKLYLEEHGFGLLRRFSDWFTNYRRKKDAKMYQRPLICLVLSSVNFVHLVLVKKVYKDIP